MPRHITKELFVKRLNDILKTDGSPLDKFTLWINYLTDIGNHFYNSNEQKPNEYYTLEYKGIHKVLLDPNLLSYFANPKTQKKEYLEIESIYYKFMECKDGFSKPREKCGFNWEFYKSWKAYHKYIKELRNNHTNAGKTKKSKKKSKRKTRKSKELKAVCVLNKNKNNITGIIKFKQKNKRSKVKITYNIKGLTDGFHGFHVHESGDLTDKCNSCCSHFNPLNKNHGGPNDKERHVGDLGNIKSKNGIAKKTFYDNLISLQPSSICNIIGRSIVIHKDKDDLGKGGDLESLKTGNAGKRLACGVIGISNIC